MHSVMDGWVDGWIYGYVDIGIQSSIGIHGVVPGPHLRPKSMDLNEVVLVDDLRTHPRVLSFFCIDFKFIEISLSH